jgi:hypothetical protein
LCCCSRPIGGAESGSASRRQRAGGFTAQLPSESDHAAEDGPYYFAIPIRQAMEFRIQYFGEYDTLLYAEEVDVNSLDEALSRARSIVNEHDPSFADPAITGYVILDNRGRLVARGYKR